MLELLTLDNAVALVTLTLLEVVLGIDNIVFIAIVAAKLGPERRDKARLIGLAVAVITRLLLLFTISFIASLTTPIFTVMSNGFSGRDIILVVGGIFLIWKATKEIHEKIEEKNDNAQAVTSKTYTMKGVITQIVLIDIIFSLDSVITAVGMSNNLTIMGAAVILAVIAMLAFSKLIIEVIERHPSIKIIALSFLMMIGLVLIADGFGQHIPKGYIYFAMAFSLLVEFLNIKSGTPRSAK